MLESQILELAEEAHRCKIAITDAWNKKKNLEHKVLCENCERTGCCNQLVLVGLYEGVMIAHELRKDTKNIDRYLNLIKQSDDQITAIMNCGFDPKHPTVDSYETAMRRTSSVWFDTDTPCALLHQGKCYIYEIRPSACATYYVLNHPNIQEVGSKICSPPSAKQVPCINNKHIMTASLSIDSTFIGYLLDNPKDEILIPPLPLGKAVYLGMQLLQEGTSALSEYKVMTHDGHTNRADKNGTDKDDKERGEIEATKKVRIGS